jgi:hypothetical protein
MRIFIAFVFFTSIPPLLFADGTPCGFKIAAANLQDGGLEMSSIYSITLPSSLPPVPFVGKPEDCIYRVTALGIPNARSFLQSNFALKNADNANFREKLTLQAAQLIKTAADAKLTFKKFRFTDGASENSNIQELELSVRPTGSSNIFYVEGTWNVTKFQKATLAFPAFLVDVNSPILINWSKKPDARGAVTQLDIFVPTSGYQHVIYRATSNGQPPMIEPFSSTVGALADQGLMPQASVLSFESEQECMTNFAPAACF